MARILLITDAWHPQTNGVVTTLTNLVREARNHGDVVHVYHPGRCTVRFSLPQYPEVTVGIPNPLHIRRLLKRQRWDHIHIATLEGPLGIAFARTCRRLRIPFSASCHTKFPEFVNARWPWISVERGWRLMRWAYRDATAVLTTTESMVRELRGHGFTQPVHSWTRGVDTATFYPYTGEAGSTKIVLCVSRVSHEKGLDDFCSLDIPGTQKVLVGDGPYLEALKARYPDVLFAGKRTGHELGDWYRRASVFVFPSRSDTFGVVNIEALACGTPVAAYPVTGPIDILTQGVNGYLSDDLHEAVVEAMKLSRQDAYDSSTRWTWKSCYEQFSRILIPAK